MEFGWDSLDCIECCDVDAVEDCELLFDIMAALKGSCCDDDEVPGVVESGGGVAIAPTLCCCCCWFCCV